MSPTLCFRLLILISLTATVACGGARSAGRPPAVLVGEARAVLGEEAFVLRWFAEDAQDRLLVVNLGRTVHFDPAPEPLLAPPRSMRWRIAWSSEHPRYHGLGTPSVDAAEEDRKVPTRPGVDRPFENWRLLAESAVVLIPENV